MYDSEKVLPHILKTFNSRYEGIRYWGIQIASNFPCECLFTPLVRVLRSEDVDLKLSAIDTLAQLALNGIESEVIAKVVKAERDKTSDKDVRELANEVLMDIRLVKGSIGGE